MPMKNPPQPGKVVRVSCLEPLGVKSPGTFEPGELSRPYFSRHGGQPCEGFRLYDGNLNTVAGGLRRRAGASTRG